MEENNQEYQLRIVYSQEETTGNDNDVNLGAETGGNSLGGYIFINDGAGTNYIANFLSNLQTILNINEDGDERTENPCMAIQEFASAGNQSDVNNTISDVPFKYKCVPCGKKFVTQAGLSSHKRSHCKRKGVVCPIESQPFWCKTCRKSFPSHQRFVQHKTPHPLAKPGVAKQYVCQTCGKHFTTMSSLRIHKRSHTREIRPFKCNVCKKGFRSPGSLSTHKLLHTRGKLYKCDECILCYGSSGALGNHKIRKHTPPSATPPGYHFCVPTL